MNILAYPNPLLFKKNALVDLTQLDPIVAKAKEMLDLMHQANGVGLAAPQIGWNIQLFVFNETNDRVNDKIIINPTLHIDLNENYEDKGEGCLSVPYAHGKVKRYDNVDLDYQTIIDGKLEPRTKSHFDSFAAHIIQHEMDHLDGILFVDKLNSAEYAKNKKVLRELEEMVTEL